MNKRMDLMNWIIGVVVILIALELVVIVVGFSTELNYFESFRVIFGSVYVLFLPGWVWSFVFFDGGGAVQGGRKVDLIERIALSFALSIAIVPLAVFYLNLIGLKISAWSSFFVVLGLVLIGIGFIYLRKNRYAG